MKKKLLTFLMIIASAFTLTACSDSEKLFNERLKKDKNTADVKKMLRLKSRLIKLTYGQVKNCGI